MSNVRILNSYRALDDDGNWVIRVLYVRNGKVCVVNVAGDRPGDINRGN